MTGYNGWTNYETWLIALHLGNDAYLNEQLIDITREAADAEEAAESLETFVTDLLEETFNADNVFMRDIVTTVLNSVNWREIAESEIGERILEAMQDNLAMVKRDYQVDSDKRICSPGKFEGEPFAAVLLWEQALEGFADDDDGEVYRFHLSTREMQEYGLDAYITGDTTTIELVESEVGFVSLSSVTEEE